MTHTGTSESESSPTGVGRNQLRSGGTSMVGKVVADRYVIQGILGAGAMGTVFKARHKLLNREVALKMLKPETAEDGNSRKRFENEALAASSLTHSNLIAVTDYGFADQGAPYLVMDYVQGQSLASVLKQLKFLPDDRLLTIMSQICAGLAHAHEKGLVHRDLKPSNILLTTGDDGKEDFVKIVDFGLAKPIVGDQELTHTGQIFGTPLYMSPEQCQGKKLDGRSDIYSLGCLMYRMVSGKLPFTGDNPVTTIVMHVKEPPPPIPDDKLGSDFLKALVPIINKALEKDPADRFQSANELRSDLHKAAIAEPSGSIPTVMLPPSIPNLPNDGTRTDAVEKDPATNAGIKRLIIGSTVCFALAASLVGGMTWWMLHEHPAMDRQSVPAASSDKDSSPMAHSDLHRTGSLLAPTAAAVLAPAALVHPAKPTTAYSQFSTNPLGGTKKSPAMSQVAMPPVAPPIVRTAPIAPPPVQPQTAPVTKPTKNRGQAKKAARVKRNYGHSKKAKKRPGLIRSLLNEFIN